MTAYPIDSLLPQLCEQLGPGKTVLLQAPPGAGKTTRVPLALLGAIGPMAEAAPIRGEIWMVEPRRLAVRAAAERLADSLGEAVGACIGYAIRGERRRSAQTRIEVLTDGLFLRRLQNDPALDGVQCVLFDEFHERRRDADLALALLREARPLLRPDLSIALMSATLDLSDLRQRLPEAVVLESAGRCFPVDTVHQPPRLEESLPRQVLRAIETHALSLPDGSGVLVFLPGLAEIQRCRELLQRSACLETWDVVCLHGQLPLEEQRKALRGCDRHHAGQLILASAIAESSITLSGVRLVIDSGLSRQLRYDPGTGMEGLETVPSSLASADQRRGRAGRQGPGQCVRLWSPANQQRRPQFSPPELGLADPQPVVLELAAWGCGLGDDLPWLDPPPRAALINGRDQLIALQALEADGRLSARGQLLERLGVHPRLALLMLEARRCGTPQLGCDLAAILSERDPLPWRDVGCDLAARLDAMHEQKQLGALRQLSGQLQRQLDRLPLERDAPGPEIPAAELVLKAFPEWLALRRQEQPGRFQLRQGRGARLDAQDPLFNAEALAVARLDLGHRDTRIQLALPVSRSTVDRLADEEGCWQDLLSWDEQERRIRAERTLTLGALKLRREPQPAPDRQQCRDLLIERLQRGGTLDVLGWTPAAVQLRRRLDLAYRRLGPPWQPRDPEGLLGSLSDWLGDALEGCQSWRDLDATTLENALWGSLEWSHRQELERLLPRRLSIPSGRSAELTYEEDGQVVLAVKLQEMFGCETGPTVLQGELPVTVELLSPAGRPLQRTCDLAGFWHGSYASVRKEMRGRYPKHPWPEEPWTARATAGTKRQVGYKKA
ncbi:MAG: ATP-dependent helicase HrpB [Cyanobacteriota bacterium]|nr:ATP-dependent helicase HrpB [Cyanobacteriota bacterium]